MSAFFQKLSALFISFFQLLFGSVSYGTLVPPTPKDPPATQIVNDISSHSSLSPSVIYAGDMKNTVQGVFTDGNRTAYRIQNTQMTLTHELNAAGNKTATLRSLDGKAFVENSFDAFYTLKTGETYYAAASASAGRVNTIRLGEYYYETHVRDLDFAKQSKSLFKLDKAYHVYGDRLYAELRLVASQATEALAEFGSEIKIPVSSVNSLLLEDASGTHTTPDGFDPATARYAAFDIADVGIVGFIVPSDGSAKSLSVTLQNGNYVLRQTASYTPGEGINKYDETGGYTRNDVRFGFRVYTDTTHSFYGITKAAALERSPLDGITVSPGNANAANLGYDALRGAYTLTMNGTNFQWAYDNPDFKFAVPISITCDDHDRDIYIRSFGKAGGLEAAALLDDQGVLSPISVEVCKNFNGDGGEEFFSYKDRAYGDSFFPLRLKANQTLDFTLLNLYQNWGKLPLKQLSSIEFHISYYHLSTGTTESNCIAPYFVYGKDGWTLPDHRGRSGAMWTTQPQFNSIGRLYFMKYRKSLLSPDTMSEYTGSNIRSAGLTYADIDYSYTSDCGSYDYTLRHVEFPQTDENRTFYTVDVTFNRDITFKNFRRDFDFFSFDGRLVSFDKAGWLNENNQPATKNIKLSLNSEEYLTLGSDNPYFGYFDIRDADRPKIDTGFGSNFGVIVRDSKIIKDGQPYSARFAFRNTVEKGLNIGSLTLDEKNITFKAGDSISLDLIILPYGTGREETDANLQAVRADSAKNRLTATAAIGTVEADTLVPTLRCENNTAEFSLRGGANNVAVRVNGFTSQTCPTIETYQNGTWQTMELASVSGYDGYSVFYDALTGLYDFSFICPASATDTLYRVTQ